MVIASTSSFSYKDKLTKIYQVAEELGERYDRKIEDIFAVQDEITQNVVSVLGAIEGPIALADRTRTRTRIETNLTAYEYVLLTRDARNKWTRGANDTSLELVQKAIALDPAMHAPRHTWYRSALVGTG